MQTPSGERSLAGKKKNSKGKKTASPSKLSSAVGISESDLQGLFELTQKFGLAEFEWEDGEKRLAFRTQSAFQNEGRVYTSVAAPQNVSLPAASAPAAAPVEKAAAKTNERQKQVLSPLVGTFYRSPSPGADLFVKEGQVVKPGEVLCIIEAMKLMNEIESEYSGKIVQVLVENGQPVEFGEPLFIIES